MQCSELATGILDYDQYLGGSVPTADLAIVGIEVVVSVETFNPRHALRDAAYAPGWLFHFRNASIDEIKERSALWSSRVKLRDALKNNAREKVQSIVRSGAGCAVPPFVQDVTGLNFWRERCAQLEQQLAEALKKA